MADQEKIDRCPHCGKTLRPPKVIPRTDLYWIVKNRCPHLGSINFIDCTNEIFEKIAKHSWQRSKKKEK